ncbi:Epsin-like protein ent1/2 [Metarhizium anisopliae]
MSKVMRSVKNVTKGYSSTQVKVREATSNDPWGPTGTQMSEIAQLTFNTSTEFYDIMDMLDRRLNDRGKNWRHVLKALKVLDYCLHEGSELVVTWARQNDYLVRTLREFQYIDEEGRDVGQNGSTVRVAAKDLSSLLADDARLRDERSNRRNWKSRVTGVEEYEPQHAEPSASRRPRDRRALANDENDAEYRLAIEASKVQEEEDRKKRESRRNDDDDNDLAKAIKLSQEEEERRRRELEDSNANSLFDDYPPQPSTSSQPQYTGFNQGYQQGNQVDFFANPVDQNAVMNQPTGFMNNAYTGYQQSQATGFQPNYNQAFGMQPTGMGLYPYGQQQNNMTGFQPQATGFNPYAQQMPQLSQQSSESALQPGSNNPWATNKSQQQPSLMPTPTGSNNPFAQNSRPLTSNPISTLGALPEQKTLSTFNNQPMMQHQQPQQQPQHTLNPPPQKEMNDYQSKLNNLLATGDGMDTYGNTGELRIPAQHTAPGMFANSAGSGVQRLGANATGNPYMRQQFTGMPSVTYGSQPTNGQGSNNPFGAGPQQQQGQGQDLIQF